MSSNVKISEDNSATFTGWASTGTAELKKFSYHPRPLGPKDVELEISHCGICGSDVHTITSGWGELRLGPCIPGHEIIGKVVAKGEHSHHNIGDLVGVGAQVDSCGECNECKVGGDQYCSHKAFTYNDTYKDGRGGLTYGGYADRVRVNSDFAFKIPDQISAAEAAPLLCAGVTTYAPLKHHGAGPGKKVGVIGIGGLGHLGIQWARALNCDEVVAISTSDNKREEAAKLGATKFVNSKKPEDMKAAAASMDIILCTSFALDTNWGEILSLVANHGKLVLLALPEKPLSIPGGALISRQVSIVGSLIGGKIDVAEMLRFAAEKNVRPLIEKMPMSDANAAVKHMMEGRPRYRIVMETEAASRL
ncbi:hypothetical protein BGZ80_001053 [Entomortierella chlamydospora]|uniref:Enoyl reductase (ER) domain-containing protein n=1 Tax=Entomortierella chlamydospora TaxID=101097 RepID=A0A9P6MRI2_9FUNG|nr:hypothetical protein BGZ79_007369 [Entomortierella chlamydospora]KAG0010961.1 hypothetical protein BGZ80_001053 [Entomortierella chlamydospora]